MSVNRTIGPLVIPNMYKGKLHKKEFYVGKIDWSGQVLFKKYGCDILTKYSF